jgi:hypothetical protein
MKIESLGWAALVVGALAASPASASTVINGNSLTRSVDCKGDAAVVNGNRSTLTLRNCSQVTVNGNQNDVNVSTDAVTVLGSNNTVTWTGSKPTVVNMGSNNTVKSGGESSGSDRPSRKASDSGDRGSVTIDSSGVKVGGAGGVAVNSSGTITLGGGESSGDAFIVDDDAKTVVHDCKGGDAEIRGDSNTIRLTDCHKITVSGDANTLRAAGADAIDVLGDANTVSWNGDREPHILNTGERNTIAKK